MYQPTGGENNNDGGDATGPPVSALNFFGNGSDAASIAVSAASIAQSYGLLGDGIDDPAQAEMWRLDKQAIYAHPLMPLLSCLLEKCELATSSPRDPAETATGPPIFSAITFKDDLEAFIKLQHQQPSFYAPNPELDNVMLLAIRVLRFHLMELEKVHELCDNFCSRYVTSLKQKMPMDVVSEDRTASARPPSSMSSPSGTAGSSSSPVVGTPMNMPMYPHSFDNHIAASADSESSHSSSHPSNFQTQQLEPPKPDLTPTLPPSSNGHTVADLTRMSSNSSHDMKPGHSLDPSIHDNNGYNQITDNEYKPQIPGLDGSSDAGDESLSLCGSLHDDGGRDSVSSEGHGGNGSDPTQSSTFSSNGRRKVPKVFSKEAINKFRSWLFQNLSHPYPSEDQKKQLANDTGLTILQVNNWFINARRRIVQPMIDSNNRAGKSPHVNVFKNRRRKNSGSPGPSPDPPSVTSSSSYNVDASALTMPNPAAAAAAAASTYPPMFPNPYQMPPFHNPAAAFPPQMFMQMNPYTVPTQPWMDLSGDNSSS